VQVTKKEHLLEWTVIISKTWYFKKRRNLRNKHGMV